MVSESPRWLFKRGKKEQAHAALLRSRTPEQAARELHDMEEAAQKASTVSSTGKKFRNRCYAANTWCPSCLPAWYSSAPRRPASIRSSPTTVPSCMQSGLSDLYAHWGFVVFMAVNFLMTFVGMALVDRKGRKFLLTIGTSGIILSLVGVGILFLRTEKLSLDAGAQWAPGDSKPGADAATLITTLPQNCLPPRAMWASRLTPAAPRWPSSTLTAITPPPPALCVPTTRPRAPSKSLATVVFQLTR